MPIWPHFGRVDERRPTLVRGRGVRVTDERGREYIDALAGVCCVNVGYGREEIVDAMRSQLESIAYVSSMHFQHRPGLELARRLVERAGLGDGARVVFTSSGSEAVEAALELARQYHIVSARSGRRTVLARRWAFHGSTLGALSACGMPSLTSHLVPPALLAKHVAPPHCLDCPFGKEPTTCALECASEVERLVASNADTLSAVLFEPIQNNGGAIVAPRGYHARLRAACDERDVLWIADEAITGFGRTGRWFGYQHDEVRPDLVVCAKGITSGYAPLGAVIVSERVARVFAEAEKGSLPFGSTFGGHPVACAAAVANLDVIEREGLCGRAERMGALLEACLRETLSSHPLVGSIRGRGLMLAVELVSDRATSRPFDRATDLGPINEAILDAGVLCFAEDPVHPTIRLTPPLVVDEADVEQIVLAIARGVEAFDRSLRDQRARPAAR